MKVKEIQVSYRITDIEISDFKASCSEDVFKIFKDLVNADREKFCVLHLNARNKIIGFEVVSIGTVTASLVSPREVFKSAIIHNAVSLILVHNHPGGEPSPSRADKVTTNKLLVAAELMDINILDHIIIGDNTYFSFADNGLIANL